MFNFPNVSNIGINKNFNFFGAGFNYSNIKRYVIDGVIYNPVAGSGITGIWFGNYGVNNVLNELAWSGINGYQELSANGHVFTTGQILSITFPQGTDVNIKPYTADVVCYESGFMYNMFGGYYEQITTKNFKNLGEFSEGFELEQKSNGGFSLRHNATVRFISGRGETNSIATAKSFAKQLFTGNGFGIAFYSGFDRESGRRTYTEKYDLINGVCNFSETFDVNRVLPSYFMDREYSYSLQSDKTILAIEKNNIVSRNPNFALLKDFANQQMSFSYNRLCSGFTGAFLGAYPKLSLEAESNRLNSGQLYKHTFFDIFSNSVSYEVAYTNAPMQNVVDNAGVPRVYSFPSYSVDRSLNEDNFLTYNLKGVVKMIFPDDFGKEPTSVIESGIYVLKNSNPFTSLPFLDSTYTPIENSYSIDSESATIEISKKLEQGWQAIEDPTIGTIYYKRKISYSKPIAKFSDYKIFSVGNLFHDNSSATLIPGTIHLKLFFNREVVKNFSFMGKKDLQQLLANAAAVPGNTLFITDCSLTYDPNTGLGDLNVGIITE